MKVLRLRNTNLEVVDGDLITSINVYKVSDELFTDETGQEFVKISGRVLVSANNVQTEDGTTLTTSAEIVDHIHLLQNEVSEIGEAVRLGNIELRSTGEEILQINANTNRKTLNVFQEVTATGTERVFFRNQDPNEYVNEDSSNAYNPVSVHTGTAVLNAAGRYVVALDILVSGSKFVQGYRSKSPTGIQNGNVKVFNITQAPHDVSKYNELSGTDISAGWYISKRPHWKYRKEAEIDNIAGFDLLPGDIELPLAEGFELVDGQVYRFVISADNEFTMEGYDSGPLVTGIEGATQFVPYLEREYFGQVDTLVRTHGSLNLLGVAVDFRRDNTDTTILVNAGAGYDFSVNSLYAYEENGRISIASVDGGTAEFNNISHDLVTIASSSAGTTITGVVNALNALFQVTPLGLGGDYISTLPVLDGVDITANFAEGQTPITGDLYGVASDTSQHGARVWSDETIDESGEYYEVKITGKGQFMLGLYSVDDGDLTEILNNSGNGHSGYKWANAFYNYGSYIAPWTTYGSNSGLSYGPGWSFSGNDKMLRYKQTLQDNFVNGNPVLFKVGIGANGHVEVYYYDEGVTNQYIMTARSSYTLPTGNYGLLVKLVNGTARLVELPKRVAVDPVAPTMTYYFAESPDTNFVYPLFQTEEEANYQDTQNGGGGTSHQHVLADDAVPGRIWYMPDTGGTMNGTAAPSNTAEITYNEIQTQADELFVPAAYPDTTITVNEGDSLNVQLHPQDASFVTSIGGISAWSYNNGFLQGTAPEVAGDNVSNPSDTTTVTVYRTNNFGTSSGTLTIVINNLTAPVVTPITGFTHDATSTAMVDSDTLADGSVVAIDETLDKEQRIIINASYVETNILPALNAAGDKYIIGSLNAAADVSSVEESDFDFAIVWEYQTETSHKFKFVRDGVQIHSVGIGSRTVAVYDYAIEIQSNVLSNSGASDFAAWLIACNVNSINTEPSPEFGGSFSHAYKVTPIDSTTPVTLSIAAVSTTADIATDMTEITTPAPNNWIQVTAAAHVLSFDGGALQTLQAGNTYRFLVGDIQYLDGSATGMHADDVIRFTADGVTEYLMDDVIRVGTPGVNGAYFEFTVPQDVPPIWFYTNHTGVTQNDAVTTSGSTHVVTVTGITLEGPAANQTGTNVADAGEHGWISLDEQLSAGERLVMDNAFFNDLLTETRKKNTIFAIGLKGNNWSNTTEINSNGAGAAVQNSETFRSNTYIVGIWNSGASGLSMWIFADGVASNMLYMNSPSNYSTTCAFLEITSDGNNIRAGMGRNKSTGNITQGDESTVTYADWNAYKKETVNRTLGISSIDVVMSFWTYDGGAIDGDNIDWTGLSEIAVPVSGASSTSFTHATSFTGSNQYAQQGYNGSAQNPMWQEFGTSVSAPAAGFTVSDYRGNPFMVGIRFKIDGNPSDQVIFGQCEGNGSGDDNIMLKVDQNRDISFHWGYEGSGNTYNKYTLMNSSPTNTVMNLVVVFTGYKMSANDATSTNLDKALKFYQVDESTGIATQINGSWNTQGAEMNRRVRGTFFVGGRGANKSFHGDVQGVALTTLKLGAALPSLTEISEFVRDPEAYIDDLVGQTVRQPNSTNLYSFARNTGSGHYGYKYYKMDVWPNVRTLAWPLSASTGWQLQIQNGNSGMIVTA